MPVLDLGALPLAGVPVLDLGALPLAGVPVLDLGALPLTLADRPWRKAWHFPV